MLTSGTWRGRGARRQYGVAVETLGRLVQQEPGNPRAMTLLAVAYDRLHRSDLADRYYAAYRELQVS